MYVAAFWNGVDLRYREIEDPKIRLNIFGIVVNTVKNETSHNECIFQIYLYGL